MQKAFRFGAITPLNSNGAKFPGHSKSWDVARRALVAFDIDGSVRSGTRSSKDCERIFDLAGGPLGPAEPE